MAYALLTTAPVAAEVVDRRCTAVLPVQRDHLADPRLDAGDLNRRAFARRQDDEAVTAAHAGDRLHTERGERGREDAGVETIASVRGGDGLVVLSPGKGSTIQVTGVEPGISKVISLDWQDGTTSTIDNLGATGAVVSKAYAKDHNLTVGSPITVISPTGDVLALTSKGIFAPPTGGSPFGTVTISSAAFDQHWQQPLNLFTFVKMEGGVTEANTAASTSRSSRSRTPRRRRARSSPTTRSAASSRC